MNDAQPFEAETLPLSGLRLIEASAGTGKTFILAGLYLRLIVEQNASVRDILVMTFTRAATQELRERIRARLADAARIAYAPEHAAPDNPEHRFTLAVLDTANKVCGAPTRTRGLRRGLRTDAACPPPQWEAAIRTYERRGFTQCEPFFHYECVRSRPAPIPPTPATRH